MSNPHKIRKDYYKPKQKGRSYESPAEDEGKPKYGWLIAVIMALLFGAFFILAYLKKSST